MKYFVVSFLIVFSVLSLAPNMQGAQFFKIGKMLHHFTNHHDEHGISFASFLDFLEEHYSKDANSKDEEHKDLPFKSVSPTSIQLTINDITISPVLIESKLNFPTKVYFSEPQFTKSSTQISIWNPPRI